MYGNSVDQKVNQHKIRKLVKSKAPSCNRTRDPYFRLVQSVHNTLEYVYKYAHMR